MLRNHLKLLWQKGKLPCSTIITGQRDAFEIVSDFVSETASKDLVIIEPKEQRAISVEQIRDLNRWSNETALVGPYKFAIIKDADKLTFAAINACLKTLEEPGSSRFFFLISSNPKSLPKTLISRCQIFYGRETEYAGEYLKLVNAILSFDKEAVALCLSSPESNQSLTLLFSNWIKSKVAPLTTTLEEEKLFARGRLSNLIETASKMQALARNYLSLALDAKHAAAILLHELSS